MNEYLAAVHCPSGNAWCMAFVYWCFKEASKQLGRENPVYQTAGAFRRKARHINTISKGFLEYS